MGCFLVPATEAIITTVATKVIERKERKSEAALKETSEVTIEKFSTKLKRLNALLWGGSTLLAFEHVWHGEVTAFFPYLTAANSPEEWQTMLGEMSTVGVGMAVAITAIWAVSSLVLKKIDKKPVENQMEKAR